MRRAVPFVAIAVLAGVIAVAVARQGHRGGLRSGQAQAAIESFFASYVEGDGRVVRHDESGDTVSEGQAYAMLLALAAGDRSRFERVWSWTKENLQRPDGLLSWKWVEGEVVDDSPASDADLDAARALVLAGRSFGAKHLTSEGKRIATAVLDLETVEVDGQLILVAGPWAVERRIVNPSYVSPCTYVDLQTLTGDSRWDRLRISGTALIGTLLEDGQLPPDWATMGADGRPGPIGAPGGLDKPVQYGLDAARLPFRLAETCDENGQKLAARLWPRLEALDGGGAAVAYGLDGQRLTSAENPLGLVAAAASATAAGEERHAERLLALAVKLQSRHPTYYGGAWIAFGQILLEDAHG